MHMTGHASIELKEMARLAEMARAETIGREGEAMTGLTGLPFGERHSPQPCKNV